MADLIEILDAHVATRTARDEQRADRFHVTIRTLRDPRRSTRQGSSSGLDRVDHVGLPLPTPHLTVRAIDLDHHHPRAAQMPTKSPAIPPPPFHPHPFPPPQPRPPPAH